MTSESEAEDPPHGILLKALLTEPVEIYGWEELARRHKIKCFAKDQSRNSSPTFLRNKVDMLYLKRKCPNSDIWALKCAARARINAIKGADPCEF